MGNGHSWLDPWQHGERLLDVAPGLVATVPVRPRRTRTLCSAMSNNNAWIEDIRGPLMVPLLIQYLEVRQRLGDITLYPVVPDWLQWRWSTSGSFSTSSSYTALFTGQHSIAGSKELWKVGAPNKCRFHIWLVLLGRCWTS
jgi:hypothetical protein